MISSPYSYRLTDEEKEWVSETELIEKLSVPRYYSKWQHIDMLTVDNECINILKWESKGWSPQNVEKPYTDIQKINDTSGDFLRGFKLKAAKPGLNGSRGGARFRIKITYLRRGGFIWVPATREVLDSPEHFIDEAKQNVLKRWSLM